MPHIVDKQRLLQKPYEKKQSKDQSGNSVKKIRKPNSEELESILTLENFFTNQWKSLQRKNSVEKTEWEILLASNLPSIDRNGAHEIGALLSKIFEYTKIGKFEYYHRAGKNTFSCVHNYEQNVNHVIEKFIIDVIKKELECTNIHVISKDNQVSIVFR